MSCHEKEELTPSPPATEPTQRGFGLLPCPKCAEKALIRIYLDDLTVLECNACDEQFTVADVQDFIAAWKPVLAWFDAAPMKKQE